MYVYLSISRYIDVYIYVYTYIYVPMYISDTPWTRTLFARSFARVWRRRLSTSHAVEYVCVCARARVCIFSVWVLTWDLLSHLEATTKHITRCWVRVCARARVCIFSVWVLTWDLLSQSEATTKHVTRCGVWVCVYFPCVGVDLRSHFAVGGDD